MLKAFKSCNQLLRVDRTHGLLDKDNASPAALQIMLPVFHWHDHLFSTGLWNFHCAFPAQILFATPVNNKILSVSIATSHSQVTLSFLMFHQLLQKRGLNVSLLRLPSQIDRNEYRRKCSDETGSVDILCGLEQAIAD